MTTKNFFDSLDTMRFCNNVKGENHPSDGLFKSAADIVQMEYQHCYERMSRLEMELATVSRGIKDFSERLEEIRKESF
jgi:hypothetical protein